MGPLSITRLVVPGALALGAGVASAQDIGSYQLPPAPRPSATAQGPVVSDVPPPRPATAPTPAPSPAPTPTNSSAETPRIVLPSPSRRPAREPARPSAPDAPPSTPAEVAPTPPPASPPTIPVVTPSSSAATQPYSPANPPLVPAIQTQPETGSVLPWIGLVLGLFATLGGYLFFQRRQKVLAPEAVFELPVVRPVSEPEPVPEAPAQAIAPLSLDLSAARMSATLFNATLSYRLTVAAGTRIDSLIVRGDMVAAHASRPAEEQLGSGDAPVLHRTGPIEDGEHTELTGDIRLPLAAITPIRHGNAALFVPLVRFELEGMSDGKPLRLRAAFVVGLEERGSDARLQPFRLDAGPRIYAQIGRRALPVPAFA